MHRPFSIRERIRLSSRLVYSTRGVILFLRKMPVASFWLPSSHRMVGSCWKVDRGMVSMAARGLFSAATARKGSRRIRMESNPRGTGASANPKSISLRISMAVTPSSSSRISMLMLGYTALNSFRTGARTWQDTLENVPMRTWPISRPLSLEGCSFTASAASLSCLI